MKNDPLPPEGHVSRYCSGSTLDDGLASGASFKLKSDEEYLSVNGLEFLGLDDREKEIDEIKKVLASKLKIGGTAIIAALNVGEVQNFISEEMGGYNCRILHRPDEPDPDPSHSGIFDTAQKEDLISELLAEIVRDVYPAK